jgi:hypothetical protein
MERTMRRSWSDVLGDVAIRTSLAGDHADEEGTTLDLAVASDGISLMRKGRRSSVGADLGYKYRLGGQRWRRGGDGARAHRRKVTARGYNDGRRPIFTSVSFFYFDELMMATDQF